MSKVRKKKAKPVEGVVEVVGSPVRRTNRFFISLRSYGHCDGKDKAVLAINCSATKLMAPPDRPLVLIACILDELLPAMVYSSKEEMETDLMAFKAYVAGLNVVKGNQE